MARSAEEFFENPAVVVINPDDDVTPEAFFAWLDEIQAEEPLVLPVSAAQTLTEARAAGEVSSRSSSAGIEMIADTTVGCMPVLRPPVGPIPGPSW